MWKGRTVVGLPAACVATAVVYAHLNGTSLQFCGIVLVLEEPLAGCELDCSYSHLNSHQKVTWSQS